MSSANISLQNNTDAPADMAIYHYSTNFGSTGITQNNVPPGGTIGPFKVSWNTATPGDFWYASIAVSGGARPGVYVSHVAADKLLPYWKECMLMDVPFRSDNGTSRTFTVNWDSFEISLKSGSTSADMLRIGDYSTIQHVFVLMLENRSFDNLLAFSGIPGISHATTNNSNSVTNGGVTTTYNVSDSATPTSMPTDPGHEFADVLEQLCGPGATYAAPNYPAINLSGFAANYATSADEKTGLPTAPEIGDIMACFQTSQQLQVTAALASQYAICDHWFSSLPGPTWPNRFFVHGASSAYSDGNGNYVGLDDSPNSTQIGVWESVHGFNYREGSIFDALDQANIPWRIYHDTSGTVAGSIPQVTALKGISLADPLAVKSLDAFASDVASGYPYRYTFIEPNYGDITGNTYKGGSSQHPEDDVAGGENLIAEVFRAISSSPLWPNSMLVITYDEHGGFYDSVTPPGGAKVPSAQDKPGTNGFVFNQLGVRVPGLVISPRISSQVDSTVYDHSSVLATVERLFGLQPLTGRDQAANDLIHMLSANADGAAPPVLPAGRTRPAVTDADREMRSANFTRSLPDQGNIQGFLHLARKADRELSERGAAPAPLLESAPKPTTYGEADTYFREVMGRVDAMRIAFETALHARLSTAEPKPPSDPGVT
ncbi:MAG: alkaline phosphatase family protein [Novosphingobium sp.]